MGKEERGSMGRKEENGGKEREERRENKMMEGLTKERKGREKQQIK